ncbi:hypothetical protein FXF51_56340 [Nonomuraea sp. PA05]|uniref:hypothetical protein n=1 Tax=Nonomuraea sp. PA05 TaxID=2604466 RepID=UPI0011D3EB3E|nr:hypothetical protein [Nonomuraea sp. PA05]TYB50406.1 hypothetical protein FXF51_56340 [Nonomuraea sp. PA05]
MKSVTGGLIRVLAAVFVLVVSLPAPARAHVVEAGAELRVTQTFAAGEVTLVIAGVSAVPAPLRVSARTVQPLDLDLRSLTDGRRSSGSLRAGQGSADLRVTHAGPYELRVRAGAEVTSIPFRVLVPVSAPWTMVRDGAFLVTGLLVVGGVLARGTSRPVAGGTSRPVAGGALAGGVSRLVVGGASASAAVALSLLLLAPHLPAAEPDGAAPTSGTGRPYAQARFSTSPARPVTGADFTLTLRLVDGATGRPVDDLAVHHEAPVHLVVTSADGTVFRHVHPLRTAPGVLTVRLRVPRPGHYLAHAEIERQDSGGQLLSGAFDVSGPDDSYQESAPHPLTASAGRPLTIRLTSEGPIRPWLGMPGHLIVRSADGLHLAHAHGTASGATALHFTLTLPEPGRYLAWAQYATGDRLVTRPFTVQVQSEPVSKSKPL